MAQAGEQAIDAHFASLQPGRMRGAFSSSFAACDTVPAARFARLALIVAAVFGRLLRSVRRHSRTASTSAFVISSMCFASERGASFECPAGISARP
jgi:hypothetical protein